MKKIKLIILTSIILFSTILQANTYTVTAPSDGAAGSLRLAINAANANVGHDIIVFSYGGGLANFGAQGPGLFPALSDPAGVTIDGGNTITSACGSPVTRPNFNITIQNAFTYNYILNLTGGNNIIKNLNFCTVGSGTANDCSIRIASSNNTIIGCTFGINETGLLTNSPNGTQEYGIYIVSGTNNQIGNGTATGINVIANANRGIGIAGGQAIIKGNYIGTRWDLTKYASCCSSYWFQTYGIYIAGGTGHIIGGTTTCERNVIAYHSIQGIYLATGTTARIRGNLIYSNPSGAASYSIKLNTGNSARSFPIITGHTTSIIAGTCTFGDIVDVFKNTTGSTNCQDMNNFLGTAVTTGTTWSLNVATAVTDIVTATGTNTGNTETSEAYDCMTPLPIELLSFNALLNTDNYPKVILYWSTATEINSDYFVIERSFDGINWEYISTHLGAGNSTSIINYQSTDITPMFGMSYYRLKQFDYNGSVRYSDIQAINNSDSEFMFNAFYSDHTLNINYSSPSDSQIDISIYNQLGQLISVVISNAREGYNSLESTPKLSTGVYLISINYEGDVYNKKLLIK